jgi:hypothetical protein
MRTISAAARKKEWVAMNKFECAAIAALRFGFSQKLLKRRIFEIVRDSVTLAQSKK